MSAHWKSCRIDKSTSIRDAARVIDSSGLGIALLTDESDRLLGTVTDGDIRRALLAASSLDDLVAPHAQRESTVVGEEVLRGEVLDIMQALLVRHVPIVDRKGRVAGLHLLHETIGVPSKNNWAVVMAGGRGVRLGELTANTPKPMLKVAGRPILERIVWHLVASGIRRIFISVNYLAHVIRDYFGDGKRFGCSIEYLNECEPMGTAGCLSLLPEPAINDVLVCNGDLVAQVDFDSLLNFHAAGSFTATVGSYVYSHTIPFGVLDCRDGKLTAIEEKPVVTMEVNAGVYILSPEALAQIPKRSFAMTEVLSLLVSQGRSVGAFPVGDDWLDVGERQHLKRARGESHS